MASGSVARPYAEGIAWLWRLGEPIAEPIPGAVGFGVEDEGDRLAGHLAAGRLAGAVVLAAGKQIDGRLRFEEGFRLHGPAQLLPDGVLPLVRSSAGLHAGEREGVLYLATTPERWGLLDEAWALPALARYLVSRLPGPLVALPPLGCLRIDDLPGTAELQLRGAGRSDRQMERRIRRMVDDVARARARLVVAVAARALRDKEPVPTDEVWPRAVAALAEGVRRGVLEPAGHGLLHLSASARIRGRLDPRELVDLTEEEAGGLMDVAMEWIRDRLGAAESFVPPAWGYNDGTLAAATARGLAVWLPPAPGPLTALGGHIRETLQIGLPALDGLDYSPLRRIAESGLPPTVVFHGRLLDARLATLRRRRAVLAAARLARRRDLERIPALEGVRWISGRELVKRLRAHDSIEVEGSDVRGVGGTEAILLEERGRRPMTL